MNPARENHKAMHEFVKGHPGKGHPGKGHPGKNEKPTN